MKSEFANLSLTALIETSRHEAREARLAMPEDKGVVELSRLLDEAIARLAAVAGAIK